MPLNSKEMMYAFKLPQSIRTMIQAPKVCNVHFSTGVIRKTTAFNLHVVNHPKLVHKPTELNTQGWSDQQVTLFRNYEQAPSPDSAVS
jgi:hypothetical protein